MARKKTAAKDVRFKDKLLPKLTIAFFDRPRITALIWLSITVFGLFSYTSLLRREGFPSVNIPIAIVGGTYFVNDPAKVDADVAGPLSEIALAQSDVASVQSQSASNFFTVSVQYNEGVDGKGAASRLEQAVKDSGKLPSQVQVSYNVPHFGATGGDIEQIDLAVSFYDKNNQTSVTDLAAKAEEAATWLRDQSLSDVKDVFVKNPFQNVTNPATGQPVTVQRSFDRYGERQNDRTVYHDSVTIGIAASDGFDIITLDERVREALNELQSEPGFENFEAKISASFAPSIEENISELQRVLLEGLLAVLIVGSIVIAVRASLITVVSMVTVLLVTLGLLYVIGYTLNVITLFALILGLALIVDDTIIMVEAIDAARHHHKDRRKTIEEATRKVSRAMLAATATAALSFAPLLFVGGILGSFIRAIPVTIIAALIISLLVALIFIPFLARFLLLGKKQMGNKGVTEVAAGFEAALANFMTRPMLWARRSSKKLFFVGFTAVVIGTLFIAGGLFIARDVVFNIFPPTKDTNGIILSISFPQGTTIEQAQDLAAKADTLAAEVIGDNFEHGAYYATGSAESAIQQIQIKSYAKRDIKSPELVKQLQDRFNSEFKEAQVAVGQLDVGPPTNAFIVQIKANNRQAALKAANDLKTFIAQTELKRVNGSTARMTNATVSSPDQFLRDENQPIVTVSSGFDGSDTTTLVTLAQEAVNKEFTADKQRSYGLEPGSITYDLGQEEENQESFRTLALAFPVLLVVMYLLLALQFRSLLQPLLIFMAIPFSLFGIMLGLDITNNAISFFAMLGFFALVGLSIKNTILLTDFANQAHRQGLSPIDSAVAALRERFRPLFATSMTAVVSLIPLAISSPFWEGLAVVLIFGLLSSTLLVITVFPYYYLGAEYLRINVSRKAFFAWFGLTLLGAIITGQLFGLGLAMLVFPFSLSWVLLTNFYRRLLTK
jgi:multidrug efflux pump subunit AcrB